MDANDAEHEIAVTPLRPPAMLFGLPVADLSLEETVVAVGELIRRGRTTGATHQVATVNVDFLVNARSDPSLRAIIRTADLCLADGMPIVWTARAFGMPIKERVAGADLVPRLFAESARSGWRIHVFGSQPDVSLAAEELIAQKYPRARVTFDPGPVIADPADIADDLLDSIAFVDADILCVALGNPKQERFIRAHRDRLGTPVLIGIGGSLDLLVGERRRAPTWMQRLGLEWVARAVQEPARLGRRYARDLRVLARRVIPVFRAHYRRRSDPGLSIDTTSDTVVNVELGAPSTPLRAEWVAAAERVRAGADLELEPDDATRINDRALAQLIGLVRIARLAGRRTRWLSRPHERLAALLRIRNMAISDLGWDEM